ncbi:MAG: hypothetical protein KIT84_21910 [Labilithrix sp.]|nr:hypothetical protein [Labilithrix sp.]MCW5813700.1 hypothetical protein [Labilithrix sp.]
MASRTRLCAFVVGALLFAAPSDVAAAPSAAERETARRHMDEGTAAMKTGEHRRALEAFSKAHEIMHVPTTGLAVAKAHLAAGHLVEAREAAVEVARTQKEAHEPAVFEKARDAARKIEAEVKGRIPSLKIKVKGGTASKVAVDDVDVPLPLIVEPVPVNPGKRVVTAKGTEGTEARVNVEVAEKESKEVELTLTWPTTADPTAKPTPAPTNDADKPQEKPKVLGFGNEDVASKGGRRAPLAEGLIWGGFAFGAVGIGVGAVTGLMTLGKASDVSQLCENNICAPSAQSDLDSATLLATVSTIAFGVGLAGIGAGVLGLAMPRQGETKGHAGLSIRPTLNGLGGTF